MYIEVNNNGYILQTESLHPVRMKDMVTDTYVDCPNKTELKNGRYLFCDPYVCVKDGVFEYIALPTNYRGNVYVYQNDEYVIFSDDFFMLCTHAGRVHFNYEYKAHFLNTASLPLGKTWVREIQCLTGHTVYSLRNGRLEAEDILIMNIYANKSEPELYKSFKDNFDKTVCEYRNGKHALLLSGGADSRLLALVMKKYDIPFETYTAVMKPFFFAGLEDVEGAEQISGLLGIKNNLVYVEPEKADILALDRVIESMPFAEHISLIFMTLMEQIHKDNRNVIWAGQNADTLYNLGPSGRFTWDFMGFMNLYKRFCISEEFYQSYPEVTGYSAWKRKINYMVANIGRCQYNRMKKASTRMPNTLEELINNYLNSYDYTIFSEEKVRHEIVLEQSRYSPHDVKKIIYSYKTKNFLKSGAPVVIDVISALYGIEKYILPFSSEYMLPVLQEIHLTKKNMFMPKKFIYQYIKEFEKDYGKKISCFDNISRKQCARKYGSIAEIHAVYESIMQNTEIGKTIRKGRYEKKPSGWTGVQYIQTVLGEYWIEKVISLLEDKYGVKVLNRR